MRKEKKGFLKKILFPFSSAETAERRLFIMLWLGREGVEWNQNHVRV